MRIHEFVCIYSYTYFLFFVNLTILIIYALVNTVQFMKGFQSWESGDALNFWLGGSTK